jgi:NADPH2:quinone reductase
VLEKDHNEGASLYPEDSQSSSGRPVTDPPEAILLPNHFLVKIRASAIHPSNTIDAKGEFGLTSVPRVPGRDFAGVIAEGPSNRLREEVYGTHDFTQASSIDGAHAEYILIPEDDVAPKPKSLVCASCQRLGPIHDCVSCSSQS